MENKKQKIEEDFQCSIEILEDISDLFLNTFFREEFNFLLALYKSMLLALRAKELNEHEIQLAEVLGLLCLPRNADLIRKIIGKESLKYISETFE